jgi:hypothetical protein
MGNTTSAEIQGALPGADSNPPSPTPIGAGAPATGPTKPTGGAASATTPRTPAAATTPLSAGVKLYRYQQTAKGGTWELVSGSAVPRFYDANEDAAARHSGGEYDDEEDDDEEEDEGARGRGGRLGGGGGASARKRATTAKSSKSSSARADWYLEVEAGGADDSVDARADDRLQYVADAAARRVTFAASDALWALRFPSREAYHHFSRALEGRVFCNTYGVENDDAGRAKVLGDFKDVFYDVSGAAEDGRGFAPMEVDPATGDAPADVPAPGELSERVLSPGNQRGRAPVQDAPIHDVIVGGAERSYVVRGGEFDVMRNVEGGLEDTGLTFSLTPLGAAAPPSASARGGRASASATPPPPAGTPPGKAILANRETRVNMLTPGDSSRLLHGDIEYGKVVSEWRFAKDGAEVGQQDIATESKSAQLGDSSVFLGLDSNRLCKWDVRDRRGVVQTVESGGGGGGGRMRTRRGVIGGGDDEDDGGGLLGAAASPAVVSYQGGKDYSRGTNFTCMATSGDGYVAVGSRDGRIRLYSSSTLTQARTSIPGLGKPITAVDVTYDGRWVLATTDDYLMVVKAAFVDQAGAGEDGAGGQEEKSAFVDRGGGKLALPRLLRLKPEDVLLTGGKPLRGGKFTWVTEQGRQERWIVASCGNYSVVWNFRRVKASGGVGAAVGLGGLPTCLEYHLQRRDAEVVTSAFLADRYAPASGGRPRDSLVVATKEKVFSVG